MGTPHWNRAIYTNSGTSVPWTDHYQVMALQPNDSLVRCILEMNQNVSSTANTFIDQGVPFFWGLCVGTSSTTPPGYPFTNANTTAFRWLYWDQVQYDPIEAQVIAGSTSYIARNTEQSQHVDIKGVRYRNTTSSAQFVWWTFEADPSFTPSGFFWDIAASAQSVYETFP